MLTRIIDAVTKELSEAINMIWSEETLEANLRRVKNDATLGGLKQKIDLAQELLLELQIYLETFETKVALNFYTLDDNHL